MSTHTNIIAFAIGASLAVVSSAACFIYKIIQDQKEEKKHVLIQHDVSRLTKEVAALQEEIQRLQKSSEQQKNKRRIRRRIQTNESSKVISEFETDVDSYSVADTDIGDDEFYDCSDINDDTDTEVIEMQKLLLSRLANIDAISDEKSQTDQIYNSMKELFEKYPNDVETVWRFARACYNSITDETDTEKKKKYLEEGLAACERVLGHSNNNSNLYKWYAILIGYECQSLPIKERIKNGIRYKEYIEKALELKQSDSTLHYLLGRFKFEVSNLSWFERQMATTLFAEPPKATYDEALKHFEDAERLSEKLDLENKLFLSKCYIALSKYQEACNCLKMISEIIPESEQEREVQIEAENLLSKYSQYYT